MLALFVLIVTLVGPGETTSNSSSSNGNASTPSAEAEAGTETGADDGGQVPEVPDLSRRIDGDPAALGAVDAPVVLIEYADYRCPYCGVFARETMPTLVQEYVDEGLLRIEWRDVPLFGEESVAAAVATRAAGQQGLFWEYSEALFAYPGRDHQPLPRPRLLEIAAEVGVPDLAAFEAALDDASIVALVAKDAQGAQAIGVRSTPTFIIGQTPVMGAQPVDVFRAAIDAELALVGQR